MYCEKIYDLINIYDGSATNYAPRLLVLVMLVSNGRYGSPTIVPTIAASFLYIYCNPSDQRHLLTIVRRFI